LGVAGRMGVFRKIIFLLSCRIGLNPRSHKDLWC
jgi:hypothetical protein